MESVDREYRKGLGKRISDAFMPKPVKKILYTNIIPVGPAYINGWSFMHMLSGVIVGMMKIDWLTALIIHTLWEIFQATIGDNSLDVETLFDVPLDTMFFMMGWWVGRWVDI